MRICVIGGANADIIATSFSAFVPGDSNPGTVRLTAGPFLLARIKDLTGGDSLASNIQLVLNNARLAARVAKKMVS